MNYQNQTLATMNGVELVIALYDGMIRFLHGAIVSVEKRDIAGRRDSVRRVLEILTYLQARLRVDIGGQPATTLAEFYAAMYGQCVRASRDGSIQLLQKTIRDIRTVREAWYQVAQGENATNIQPRERQTRMEQLREIPQQGISSSLLQSSGGSNESVSQSHRWSA